MSPTFFRVLGHVIVFSRAFWFLTPNQNAAAKITLVVAALDFHTAKARVANETTAFLESPFSPNSSHQFTKMPSATAFALFSLPRGDLLTVAREAVFLVDDDDSSEQQDEAGDENVPQEEQVVNLAGQGEREPETKSPV